MNKSFKGGLLLFNYLNFHTNIIDTTILFSSFIVFHLILMSAILGEKNDYFFQDTYIPILQQNRKINHKKYSPVGPVPVSYNS